MSEAGPSNMDALARWARMSRSFIHYSETFCRHVHFCPRLRNALGVAGGDFLALVSTTLIEGRFPISSDKSNLRGAISFD